MADGSVVISIDLDDKKAQTELNRLSRKVDSINAQMQAKTVKRDYLAEQAAAIQAQYKEAIANDQDFLAEELAKKYTKVQAAIERINEQLRYHQRELNVATNQAGQYAAQLTAQPVEEIGEQAEQSADSVNHLNLSLTRVQSSMGKLQHRLLGLAKRVFIFSMFTQMLRGVRTWLSNTLSENEEFKSSLDGLKTAAMSAFQPMINWALPALITLLQKAATIMESFANITTAIFGAAAEAAGNAASAAKETKKQLAGFDTLNVLSSNDSQKSTSGLESMKKELDAIDLLTGELLLVMGAVLTFSGAAPGVGIAMMVAGAMTIYAAVSTNWESIKDELEGPIGAWIVGASALILAIGAVLAFTGAALPLGVAMMAIGAAGLFTALPLNWNFLREKIAGFFRDNSWLTSGLKVLIGLLLMATMAFFPLGLGLVQQGMIGEAENVATNFSSIMQTLQKFFAEQTWVKNACKLILGILLVCTVLFAPLGIGLIAAGAKGLAKEVNFDSNALAQKIQLPLAILRTILAGSLFVLGVALLLIGAIPLGLGLIGAAKTNFEKAITANDNLLLNTVKGVWAGLKAWYAVNVAKIFTKEWWGDKFSVIGDALVAAGRSIGNVFIELVEFVVNGLLEGTNVFVDALNALSFSVPDWVPAIGGKRFGLSIPYAPQITIPRLAEGAVIPPNREFLAVLGDQKAGMNVEAPLDTIVAAFRQVMSESNDGTVNLYLDGDLLARSTISRINRAARAGGKLGIV